MHSMHFILKVQNCGLKATFFFVQTRWCHISKECFYLKARHSMMTLKDKVCVESCCLKPKPVLLLHFNSIWMRSLAPQVFFAPVLTHLVSLRPGRARRTWRSRQWDDLRLQGGGDQYTIIKQSYRAVDRYCTQRKRVGAGGGEEHLSSSPLLRNFLSLPSTCKQAMAPFPFRDFVWQR